MEIEKGFSMRKQLRYWHGVIQLVFYRGDTITVRLLLANASIAWAIIVMLLPETFNRHGWELMRVFPHWSWALAFFLHGIGVYWRVFDSKQRTGWALAINGLGLAVWLLSTILINLAIGTIAASTSLEWIMCFASAWALYRTGLKSEFKLLTD